MPLTELQECERPGRSHSSEAAVIRVIVCDEEPLVRAGLRASLQNPRIDVVAEAASSRQLVETARRFSADVVLMGSGHTYNKGEDQAQYLRVLTEALECPLAIVIESTDSDLFVSCLQAGIRGFISKQSALAEVTEAMLAMAKNKAYLSPELTPRLLNWFASKLLRDTGRTGISAGKLSAREAQVLELLGNGRSNAEIASILRIKETTVRSHVYHILTKLDLRNRTEAVLHGFQANLHSY